MKNLKNKLNNKDVCFPDRTLTDEQLKNMSYDDMMLTIYQCLRVTKLSDDENINIQNSGSISHQLLRILLRIVYIHDLDLNQIWYEVEVGHLDNMLLNDFITSDEWDIEHDLLFKKMNPTKNITEGTNELGMSYKEYGHGVKKESWKNINKKMKGEMN